MIKTAVILAAGRGERLRPLTDNLPKALIKMGEKTLIEYSLDNLKRAGINKVIIVAGFLGNLIKEKIGNSYQGIDISYVSNEEYSVTGSMYSLSQIEGIFMDDSILLLESDLLYEAKILKMLVDSVKPDLVSAAPISGSGDEAFIIADKSGNLFNLGKGICDKQTAGSEFIGISKLSLPFLNKMFEIARKDYKQNKKQCHYEEVILRASKIYPVGVFRSDLVWTEIDKANDLKRAREIIFPKIHALS